MSDITAGCGATIATPWLRSLAAPPAWPEQRRHHAQPSAPLPPHRHLGAVRL